MTEVGTLKFLSLVDYLLPGIAECRLRCSILTREAGLGRFRDMYGKPYKVGSPFAQKRKRQAAWNKLCKDSGRSPEESNRAASIIPLGRSNQSSKMAESVVRQDDFGWFAPSDLKQSSKIKFAA